MAVQQPRSPGTTRLPRFAVPKRCAVHEPRHDPNAADELSADSDDATSANVQQNAVQLQANALPNAESTHATHKHAEHAI